MKICIISTTHLFLALVTLVLLSESQAFVPRVPSCSSIKTAGITKTRTTVLHAEGPNFFEMGSRFLNELLPWGDPSKGLAQGKRDAMVVKYMEKTGISKAEAEKEVDEYLQDKELYIEKKRAEELYEKWGKDKK